MANLERRGVYALIPGGLFNTMARFLHFAMRSIASVEMTGTEDGASEAFSIRIISLILLPAGYNLASQTLDTGYWILVESRIGNRESGIGNRESRI